MPARDVLAHTGPHVIEPQVAVEMNEVVLEQQIFELIQLTLLLFEIEVIAFFRQRRLEGMIASLHRHEQIDVEFRQYFLRIETVETFCQIVRKEIGNVKLGAHYFTEKLGRSELNSFRVQPNEIIRRGLIDGNAR